MNASSEPRRQRVPALSPDDRRAALIAATIPLVREHGITVSTRQIAEAAGVAEGTIFGVFPDKRSLILAAIVGALDPTRLLTALASLSSIPDLRERMELAAELVVRRVADNAKLMVIVRTQAPPAAMSAQAKELMDGRMNMVKALADLLEPDRALLRYPPATAGRMLLSTIFAAGSGIFGDSEPLDSKEIVSMLLDGLLARPVPSRLNSGES